MTSRGAWKRHRGGTCGATKTLRKIEVALRVFWENAQRGEPHPVSASAQNLADYRPGRAGLILYVPLI
jgi:hypothetical protein